MFNKVRTHLALGLFLFALAIGGVLAPLSAGGRHAGQTVQPVTISQQLHSEGWSDPVGD